MKATISKYRIEEWPNQLTLNYLTPKHPTNPKIISNRITDIESYKGHFE